MNKKEVVGMLTNFKELENLSITAKDARLNKEEFSRVYTQYREQSLLIRHKGEFSLRGVLANWAFVRKIYIKAVVTKSLISAEYKLASNYSNGLIEDLQRNTKDYLKSYNLLSDNVSKQVFVNMLAGEMLMDARYGYHFLRKSRESNYIIDDLPNPPFFSCGEKMVDCGAYIGDTLLEFCQLSPLSEYWGIDGNPESFKKLQETVRNNRVKATLYQAAVANSSGIASFASRSDEPFSATLDEEGDISVRVLTLDEIIKSPVTLIKMDIEGGELNALKGSAHIINKYKPKLAICIYHKVGDYRAIPLLIKQLNKYYSKFYIRNLASFYTGERGFLETVLYVR